ncbi:MAG: hypothetical protein ACK4NQ_00930 [Fimbriimonadaceae bacterium]
MLTLVVHAEQEPDQTASVIGRLKQEWSLHPGPLMVDAHNWLPNEVVIDGDRVIREQDLGFVAQTSGRRYLRLGRVDVFARRLKVSSLLIGGRAGSLWRFVSSRKADLVNGIPLKDLTTDEREVLMEHSSNFPAFTQALYQQSSAMLSLKIQFNWTEDGMQRSLFVDQGPHSEIVGPPTGIPDWASPRPLPTSGKPTIDFGSGRLMSVRLMLVKLAELGYSVRYDARLEESPMFLKGEFEVDEFLDATREVLETIPFFAQDRRNEAESKPTEFREVVVETLLAHGVPPALIDRLDEKFSIRANQQELLQVALFKDRFNEEWRASSEVLEVRCSLVLYCDEGVSWRRQRQDGMYFTRSQMKHILSPP